MDDITKTQQSFARKALTDPTHRFEDVYHLICREEWIRFALSHVLGNKGSRTPGMDGVTRRKFESETYTTRVIEQLQQQLRTSTYRPNPVKRLYIPKPNGKKRPLGISTIQDRVVQMLLKMLMEPIWESDFLDCSSGFRPNRRTMDCIAMCYRLINDSNKYYWVVEGDITGCFDHVQHDILLNLISKRIRDSRVLRLIELFLSAGVMEESLFHKTDEGTPQGGIAAPLWANIYLHELDRYWWGQYNTFTPHQRAKRREQGIGNCRLLRYADDFLILTNGPKAEAERLRGEFQAFLQDTLKLELSEDKTLVTHVNAGFDFLGFHIRRYINPKQGSQPVTLVTPSGKSVERLKAKIRHMTGHERRLDHPYLKFQAVNQLLRGWMGYYQHVNAKDIVNGLQFWVNERVLRWLISHHRCRVGDALSMYRHEDKGRKNLAVKDAKGQLLYLYILDRHSITRYLDQKRTNPYLAHWVTELQPTPEQPNLDPQQTWNGEEHFPGWQEAKMSRLSIDGGCCTRCGATDNLDVHHLHKRRWNERRQGNDDPTHLRTLCERCHVETFGNAK